MLDTGCWMLDAGYSMLDAGYWILDAGCRLLLTEGFCNQDNKADIGGYYRVASELN